MSVVTATIKSEGKELAAKFELLSIEINRELNRIPEAELRFVDGNAATREFELSDETAFEPGNEIEIFLRYEGKGGSASVFKGIVVRHNLEVSAGDSSLTVELRDAAFSMTLGRKSAVFQQKSDSDIFQDLIKSGKAKLGQIEKTQLKHEEMVQYHCTDWDFMLTRAEVNNLMVLAEDGEISLKKLEIKGGPKHTFEFGITDIISFEIEADATSQFQSIESIHWDIKSQKLSKKSQGAEFSLQQKGVNGKSVASKIGAKEDLLLSLTAMDPKESQIWADSAVARSRMSLFKGIITVPGYAEIKLMDVMELLGMGKRFKGQTLITGIRHSVDHEGWMTHIQFGLASRPFSKTLDIMDVPAGGLLPAAPGLQIGIVDAFEDDKDAKEFRVRVILPGIDEKKGKVWARLAAPEAGLGNDKKGRGYFFRPEKGDEVVVGFFNNDPRQPVILGALFSSKNVPPKGWDKLDNKNALKGIVSKSGIRMEIDDEKQTLTFLTAENQSIMMDQKNKIIQFVDPHDNTIVMDKEGIAINAADKITIEAKGDLLIKGNKIEIDSSSLEIKSSKVEVK